MLRIILDSLNIIPENAKTEEMRIASGKYKLKTSFKEAWRDMKIRKGW